MLAVLLHPHPAARTLATEIGLNAMRNFLKRTAEGNPLPTQGYYAKMLQADVRDSLHWFRHLVAGIHRIDATRLRPIALKFGAEARSTRGRRCRRRATSLSERRGPLPEFLGK